MQTSLEPPIHPPAHSLPVLRILRSAFTIPWRNRVVFGQRLCLPMGLVLGLSLLWYGWLGSGAGNTGAILYLIVYVYLSSLLAVACHRLVLLGPYQDGPSGLSRALLLKAISYFGSLIGILILAGIVSMLCSTASGLTITFLQEMLSRDLTGTFVFTSVLYAAKIPGAYLASRLCLVLPAATIDRDITLRGSWERTRGNGWRMFAVAAVFPMALFTLANLPLYVSQHVLVIAVVTLVQLCLLIVQITALSQAFSALSPTDAS